MGDLRCRTITLSPQPENYSTRHEYILTLVLLSPPLIIGYTDYAVVIIGTVFVFASISWVISARKWFLGPINNTGDSTRLSSMDDSDKRFM